ncbi:MAG: CDP-diacylglycerol--glycerol-3-phosphate 3-phosphatidyltransferase [Elusimicrobia bacterium]|nr:CDP-diacylglycerol--glycerol-3-phosphate 3-phosphatidyltransferase [Elusimicrobiota bacterium]
MAVMTLPNKLTIARLVMGIATFGCLWSLNPALYLAALVLYVAATITDAIDGYIARSTQSSSQFGALADPIADKVLVLGALLACMHIRWLRIPGLAVFLILVRELLIGGLRTLAGVQGRLLSADRWGKWKMGIQSGSVIAILLLLVAVDTFKVRLPKGALHIPAALTWLSSFVTVVSGLVYIRQNWRLLESSWGSKPPAATRP